MKKLLHNIADGISIVVFVIVFFIGIIITLPFDYIKYKTSLVYKKDRRKYSLFEASSSNFKVYNAALKEHIPLEFVEHPMERSYAVGWLVLGRTLVNTDVYAFDYDENTGLWDYKCENEHEELVTASFDEYFEMEIGWTNHDAGRDICDSVAVLVDRKELKDKSTVQFDDHPSFILHDGDIADALRRLVQQAV